MSASNTVLIKFRSSGDKALEKAILDLAKAQALLEGKAKQYNNAVRRLKLDKEKLNKEFGLATKNSRLLSNSFATLRSKMLLVSFGAGIAAATVGRLTKMFAEQEAAEKKLSTALGFVNQELLDFASTMQQITTFGDEVTIAAMSQAAAFTTNTDAIKQMTIAAQDLAAGRGMDLKTAMDLVSKSVFSSTNALSRYGIEIGKTGSKTEKFNKIMAKINEQYGGQAAAQVDTYAGATQQLANLWGDLGEKLGGVLAEGLLPLVKLFSLLAELLLKIEPILGKLVQTTVAFGSAMLLSSKRMNQARISAINLTAGFLGMKKSMEVAAAAAKGLRLALGVILFAAMEGVTFLMSKFGKNTEAADVEVVELTGAIKDLDKIMAGFVNKKQFDELLADIEAMAEGAETPFDDLINKTSKNFETMKAQLDEMKAFLSVPLISAALGEEATAELNANIEKTISSIAFLTSVKARSVAIEKDRLLVAEEVRKMEIDNIKFKANLIPKLEMENTLLQNKNGLTGVELEIANLLAEAEVRGIGIMELDINTIEKLIKQKIELTNVMKTELFITNSFNQALLQGINNNARFAESFGNMVKKMAAQMVAHMATFILFNTLMPGSSLFAGFASPFEYAISKLTGTTPVGAGSAMQGVALESQNAAMQGGGGSVVVNFSGNVLSQDFIENDAIPQIRDAIRRGADIGVS